MNNSKKTDPGYIDPGTCDLGNEFEPRHCQFLHYRAKNREGYDPCRYCPLIIKYLIQERGKYSMEETRKKAVSKKTCLHCKRQVNTIIGRGLCGKCYQTPEVKEKYRLLGPLVGIKSSDKSQLSNNNDGRQNLTAPISKEKFTGLSRCDSCSLEAPIHLMTLAGERLVCQGCIDAANTPSVKPSPKATIKTRPAAHCPAPAVKMPSIETVEKRLDLQPLEDLLADRRQYAEQLKKQATAQEWSLNTKLFEIRAIEKICDQLKEVIKRMRE
ncbi:MAG: hypothetical protein AB1403_10890 [Candidatus Riflebacteria bacterium]